MTKGYVMEAKQLQKLSIGDSIYIDGQWCLLSNFIDGEWELLTIEETPKTFYAREFGIEVFAASSDIHGEAPKPIKAGRQCDPLDTVFIEYVGNRQKPVIDWAYYLGSTKEFIWLMDKTKQTRFRAAKDKPVYRAFYFKETQIRNRKLDQWFEQRRK